MNTKTIEQEIESYMNSGLYSVATLDLFQDFEVINLSDNLLSHLDYTNELLNEYLSSIKELEGASPGLKHYLNAIKLADIVDNQSLEKENSFLIGLYLQVAKENAIDRFLKIMNEEKELTKIDIYNIQNLLMTGTSTEDKSSVRTNNTKFVGRVENGERIIHYFPIDYREVDEAAKKISELFNSRLKGENYDNVFFQPFILHGLFGTLQIFGDGNTRMGRLVQHILMWKLINEKTSFDFSLPPLYSTRAYYTFRKDYRTKIANLVKSNNSEAWNDWFDFNLSRIEDQIYYNNDNLNSLKLRLK